ncbi:hypothetical protein MU404_17660 [Acinetobacter baumannii]|uniref:hypothetical protein n=1 Tax=Acinetobacter baumannii TaxID=470 RepID=UPI0020BF2561|nr:hypothetical protein [Acinetobacter baumannii]MCL6185157.1 hypothetical protein [Acinetobacter baumannii]MCL6192042.1 hypothetical protein [Acinetobacter baumannii]HEM7759309.1 hypothetical protein [Acinetobacter baumannii]
MRNSTFLSSCLVISLALASCAKQVENKVLPPSVEAQFISADKEIGKMLDDLENRDISLQRKREILCKTYPEVYKNQYMPALLKLAPKVYTEETLLRDFDAVISFYKKTFVVNCG